MKVQKPYNILLYAREHRLRGGHRLMKSFLEKAWAAVMHAAVRLLTRMALF